MWTNTCCSHPLFEADEMEEVEGIKVAAIRWLKFELGITLEHDDLTTVQKILYKADSDEKWTEFELDYILFAIKDIELTPNPNEVAETKWISRDDFKRYLDEKW